jgi:hypothetical protein
MGICQVCMTLQEFYIYIYIILRFDAEFSDGDLTCDCISTLLL